MGYSKELKALDQRDVRVAISQLLGQLNLVQSETARQLDAMRREVQDLRAQLAAAVERSGT